MCGRYYVDDETAREIERLVREVDQKMKLPRVGDISPSQSAVVLTGKTDARALRAEEMFWGFPGYGDSKSKLLINARQETVTERKTFRDSVLHRRCIIPARHFYEWDPDKNQVTFRSADRPILYMAGFYQLFQEQEHFIILTTEANASIREVHDRMPLLLAEEELLDWVYEEGHLAQALQKIPPRLARYQEYEQQSLF